MVRAGYECVALLHIHPTYLGVSVEAAGNKLFLLLDSGAPRAALDPDRTQALGLHWRDAAGRDLREVGWSHALADVEKLHIGPVTAERLVVWPHHSRLFNDALVTYGNPSVDGLLGQDVLTSHSAVIDYAGCKLYLKRPAKE